MAKRVIINGVTYDNVPHVNIPLADGTGNAKFVDSDSGNVTAGDIRNGKKAWAGGNEITGSVTERSASDVIVSGKKVTTPAGIYDNPVEKNVADGNVTPSTTLVGDEIGTTVSDYPVIATPSATVTAGYVSGDASGNPVTKYIQVEEKTATPSTSSQDITPTAGKLLKKVTVQAVTLTGNATPATVPAGVTFYSTSLTKQTGTATFPTVSQDSTSKVLTVS